MKKVLLVAGIASALVMPTTSAFAADTPITCPAGSIAIPYIVPGSTTTTPSTATPSICVVIPTTTTTTPTPTTTPRPTPTTTPAPAVITNLADLKCQPGQYGKGTVDSVTLVTTYSCVNPSDVPRQQAQGGTPNQQYNNQGSNQQYGNQGRNGGSQTQPWVTPNMSTSTNDFGYDANPRYAPNRYGNVQNGFVNGCFDRSWVGNRNNRYNNCIRVIQYPYPAQRWDFRR